MMHVEMFALDELLGPRSNQLQINAIEPHATRDPAVASASTD
jgi:hypothetical protein